MKKINSINISTKVLGVISIFLFFLPLIFYYLRFIGLKSIGKILMKGSFIIGVVMLAAAFILLCIELHQDKVLDQYYTSHSQCKIALGDGKYECQNCGNREIEKEDGYCKVCGIVFKEYKDE